MRNCFYIALILCICSFACEPEKNVEPLQPFAPTKIKVAQEENKTTYKVEVLIPWSSVELSAAENIQIGFDIFLTDDDEGGLSDHKLSWHSEPGSGELPVPVNFATLILKENTPGNVPGEIPFAPNPILVDGKAEAIWEDSPNYPINHLLKGSFPENGDFSGSFRAMWDTTALYLFIEIKDDTFIRDSWTLAWEDDGVSIYVDPRNVKSKELEVGETFSYRILRNSRKVLKDNFPIPPIWSVPILEVFDGGPGIDGIPALLNPQLISASAATYLREEDLIIGYVDGEEAIAYPHKILDWHEIINDEVNGNQFAITYCPLTGTGIGWNRKINGVSTTFGVSGLLHNSNLIPYDRLTGSNWSQMRLDCLEGGNQGKKIQTIPIVETTWKTWKEMFPATEVVSLQTGFDRDYTRYPYGDYKTNDETLLFPINFDDLRLDRKTRVHGIISNNDARVYPFSNFLGSSTVLIHDEFQGRPLIVAGSEARNFIVSFGRELPDGTLLSFSRELGTSIDPSVIMKDQEGNQWNILGQAVSGPRVGTQLPQLDSYIGYWFAFGTFFQDLGIH